MSDTALMSIPGLVDPVPASRDITPRADGRVDLIGLPRPRIRELFAEAGLDDKAAKLRATKPAEGFLMALMEVKGQVPKSKLFNRGGPERIRSYRHHRLPFTGEAVSQFGDGGRLSGTVDPHDQKDIESLVQREFERDKTIAHQLCQGFNQVFRGSQMS
jgi:hypothetical protein